MFDRLKKLRFEHIKNVPLIIKTLGGLLFGGSFLFGGRDYIYIYLYMHIHMHMHMHNAYAYTCVYIYMCIHASLSLSLVLPVSPSLSLSPLPHLAKRGAAGESECK